MPQAQLVTADLRVSDAASLVKPPAIKEETVQEEASSAAPTPSTSAPVAKEQVITPFDVEGGVDENGRDIGM